MMNSNRKFIEINDSDDAQAKNDWLNYCRSMKIPYIVIVSRGRRANIFWDYISYPMGIEMAFDKNEDYIKEKLKEIYFKYANKQADYLISASSLNFNKFSIENAREAALEIYDFINNFME